MSAQAALTVHEGPRLGADARLRDAVATWLGRPSETTPSPATVAAYRRDIEGVAGRIHGGGVETLRIDELDKAALRRAFASWATDHAAASVLRAHSAWSRFFDFLVAEDLRDGSPMAAVPKPARPAADPRSIRAPDATARLLAIAALPDERAREPWPERDLALVATFCVTGIRVGEACALTAASIEGRSGARHLTVEGRGGRARSIPIRDPLETALDFYLLSRAQRFADHALDGPSTALFVDARGHPLTADQMKYLIERLYVRAGLRASVPSGAFIHALRHTFALASLQAGADVVELRTLLGHSSLEATRRYLDAAHFTPGRGSVRGMGGS